jgi:hypothetical protein
MLATTKFGLCRGCIPIEQLGNTLDTFCIGGAAFPLTLFVQVGRPSMGGITRLLGKISMRASMEVDIMVGDTEGQR